MAKDPAFLFYPNDWQGGTMTMTRHMKGCYIDLLIAQFNSGSLSLEEIRIVLGSDFSAVWGTLSKKFAQDATGKFFNERLETEKKKRAAFISKQIENGSKGGRPKIPKENPTVIPKQSHALTNKESEDENRNGNSFGKSENLLAPSQGMIEEIFTTNGLTAEEGANFFKWVNGTKGWDKINDWRDYTASVVGKKLIEKQNGKNGKHHPRNYGAAPTVPRGTEFTGL